ncbi:MAG: SDR family oxidoreductase [Planctomycetes bacterium]|nr:SDR family oxidoreductase [Planctomycetota bacterium]
MGDAMTDFYRGKTALVTGASSGIGRALAIELGRLGARCILAARRRDRLESIAEALKQAGATEPLVTVVDLLDASARQAWIAKLQNGPTDLDLLINNAGTGMNRRFLDSEPSRLDDLLSLDLEVPLELTRAFAPAMVCRGFGGVLNVASIAAFIATPFHAHYSATKAALLHWSEALTAELASSGVRVTALCPGVTDTEFFEAGDYAMKSLIYRMPRATPESVARAGLDALARGRARVIPGWNNRALLALTKILPTSWVTAGAGRAMSTD